MSFFHFFVLDIEWLTCKPEIDNGAGCGRSGDVAHNWRRYHRPCSSPAQGTSPFPSRATEINGAASYDRTLLQSHICCFVFVRFYSCILFICSYVYLSVSMSQVWQCLWKKEGSIRSPGAGISGSCELPVVSARNYILVFPKSRMHFHLQGHPHHFMGVEVNANS